MLQLTAQCLLVIYMLSKSFIKNWFNLPLKLTVLYRFWSTERKKRERKRKSERLENKWFFLVSGGHTNIKYRIHIVICGKHHFVAWRDRDWAIFFVYRMSHNVNPTETCGANFYTHKKERNSLIIFTIWWNVEWWTKSAWKNVFGIYARAICWCVVIGTYKMFSITFTARVNATVCTSSSSFTWPDLTCM